MRRERRGTGPSRSPRSLPAVFAVLFVLLLVLAGVLAGCADDGTSAGTAAAPASASTTATKPVASTASAAPSTAGSTAATDVVARPAAVVPTSLGGLPLRQYLDGDAARAQVEQLHGKALGAGLDQAWLATYGGSEPSTLWVTRSVRLEDAKALMERMRTKIAGGNTPFTDPHTLKIQGVTVEALDGMGQKHYYFRIDKDLYWLAISPTWADAGLRDLIANGLKTAKTD